MTVNGRTRIELNELEPETLYSLTLQGQNIVGMSPVSKTISFKTLPIGKKILI